MSLPPPTLCTDALSIVAEFVPLQERFLILTRVWRVPKPMHHRWCKEWNAIHAVAENREREVVRERQLQIAERMRRNPMWLVMSFPSWKGHGFYYLDDLVRLYGRASWMEERDHTISASELNRVAWTEWKKRNKRRKKR